jgi:hypothetical protein
VVIKIGFPVLNFPESTLVTSPLYYSSLAGVVSGAKAVPLRGVGPHSHPLTESSKGGPGRARPRLIAGLLSLWEVCDAKG